MVVIGTLWLAGGLNLAIAQNQEGGEYLLNPGDTLEVTVWNQPDLTRRLTVLPDGTIAYPLVGTAIAGGRTPAQLSETIRTGLETYIREPLVTVIVRAAGGSQVFVMGRVRRPGVFPIAGPLTVAQALSFAGGLSEFADKDSIVIVRKTEEGTIRIPYNLKELSNKKSTEADMEVRTGDIVFVP